MKLLLFSTLIISSLSFGQNSSSLYEIISLGTQYSTSEIESALDNANLCGLHLQNERNTLVLNDGAKINIFSANELSDSAIIIEPNCVIENMVQNISWSISSGSLLRRVEGVISPDNKIYIVK